MPKSKHRKNHKKKVASFKQKLQEKKNATYKKVREQFEEQFSQDVQGNVDKLKEEKNTESNVG